MRLSQRLRSLLLTAALPLLLHGAAHAWAQKKAPLMTPWASQVDPKHPWPDYPRPQDGPHRLDEFKWPLAVSARSGRRRPAHKHQAVQRDFGPVPGGVRAVRRHGAPRPPLVPALVHRARRLGMRSASCCISGPSISSQRCLSTARAWARTGAATCHSPMT